MRQRLIGGHIRGKHFDFNRAMGVHTILVEAFERLLFEAFEHHKNVENLIGTSDVMGPDNHCADRLAYLHSTI